MMDEFEELKKSFNEMIQEIKLMRKVLEYRNTLEEKKIR